MEKVAYDTVLNLLLIRSNEFIDFATIGRLISVQRDFGIAINNLLTDKRKYKLRGILGRRFKPLVGTCLNCNRDCNCYNRKICRPCRILRYPLITKGTLVHSFGIPTMTLHDLKFKRLGNYKMYYFCEVVEFVKNNEVLLNRIRRRNNEELRLRGWVFWKECRDLEISKLKHKYKKNLI